MNGASEIQRSVWRIGGSIENPATYRQRSKFDIEGSMFDVGFNGQNHRDRFHGITLTPALSHRMGEGDQLTRIEFQRACFRSRLDLSPSPIGWERAGVRVSRRPFKSVHEITAPCERLKAELQTCDVGSLKIQTRELRHE